MSFGKVRQGVVVAGILGLAVGCGAGGKPVRDVEAVTYQVAGLSAKVMDAAGVKGKTAGAAPPRLPNEGSCDSDNEDSPERQVTQSWSVYGVGDGPLGPAMARLASHLPQLGWKVVQNGPDSSTARNQEILAVHLATKTQLDVTWHRGHPHVEPLIIFDVYSDCFRKSSS